MLFLKFVNLLVQGCCIYLDFSKHVVELIHMAVVSGAPAFVFLLGYLLLVHHIPKLIQRYWIAFEYRVELWSLLRIVLGSYKLKMILVQPGLEIVSKLVVLGLVEVENLGFLAFEHLVLGLDAELLPCKCYETLYRFLELDSFSLWKVDDVRRVRI